METLARAANRGSISTGYDIDNSLKFEADNSEKLSRSQTTGTNRKKFTVSFWVKRTELSALQVLASAESSGNDLSFLNFETDNVLRFRDTASASDQCILETNRVFRDTSAWYHIVLRVDTTDGTADDRNRIYVNGVQETSFSARTNFDLNDDTFWGYNGGNLTWGNALGEANYYSGYTAEAVYVDGLSLAPTSFGEFDEDTGIWKPINVSGLTFGNNGYYLDFEDSSNLGNDVSGGTDFTQTNITSGDQATDTPTLNFCTWNPLWVYASQPVISEGATKVRLGDSINEGAKATIGLTNGKWYWEAKPVGTVDAQQIGIQTDGDSNIASDANSTANNYGMWINPIGYYYSYADSQTESADQGWDLTASDWLGIALDMDSGTQTINYYKNGSLIQSRDLITEMQGRTVFPFLMNYENRSWDINFGGYTINTISSAASDENGYGTFEYAPPSGYYAICTKNLAEYG
jgi:hypothetical protein